MSLPIPMPPHVVAQADQLQAWARVEWPEPKVITLHEQLLVEGYQPDRTAVTEGDRPPGG